jgi:glycosyltransferase involved in cell wall biosynthesis
VKVLHTTADWKWTGPAEPMLHAVAALRARGCEADFACPDPPPGHADGLAVRARERGLAPAHRFAVRQGYLPLRDGGEVRALRGALGRGRYDLVHAHHSRDHVLAALAARPLGIPVVASWHHGEPIPRRPWNRLRFGPRGTAGLAVLSDALAARARADFGLAPESVAVVRGVVDAQAFAPRPRRADLREALGIPAGARVLGVVARLQPHRRFDLLLEGFRRALAHAPGLLLLVVGRGTRARSVLEEPVARLGLEGRVVRAGYRRDDYRDVLALCDALAFLVPGSDGSCRAVLEAMAMEIPTLASRRGVLPETVTDGETGRLVDLDADALAGAMVELWREPVAWSARGKAARRRVLERHTAADAAARLCALYAGLLRARAAR